MYVFTPLATITQNIPEIRRLGVSIRARGKNQFLDQYKMYGSRLPIFWKVKRQAFIARTLAAYKLNPTRRRQLALLVWAYTA